mmetsp:Transcript_64607/g.162577  ORF Transcript_64607/g.162577 Transcript_64607/m.162577 type:complete len:243 (+) Transcript_64607:977-1705(+)
MRLLHPLCRLACSSPSTMRALLILDVLWLLFRLILLVIVLLLSLLLPVIALGLSASAATTRGAGGTIAAANSRDGHRTSWHQSGPGDHDARGFQFGVDRHERCDRRQGEAKAPSEPGGGLPDQVGVLVELLGGELQGPAIGLPNGAQDQVPFGSQAFGGETKRPPTLLHCLLHDLTVRSEGLACKLQGLPILLNSSEDGVPLLSELLGRELEFLPIRDDDPAFVADPSLPEAGTEPSKHRPC